MKRSRANSAPWEKKGELTYFRSHQSDEQTDRQTELAADSVSGGIIGAERKEFSLPDSLLSHPRSSLPTPTPSTPLSRPPKTVPPRKPLLSVPVQDEGSYFCFSTLLRLGIRSTYVMSAG